MRYFKIMMDGATLCCIESEIEINFNNVIKVLNRLEITPDYPIEKIIEVNREEAYEWYEVISCEIETTFELCPHCNNEVLINADERSKCPVCNEMIAPCSMCNRELDCSECDK